MPTTTSLSKSKKVVWERDRRHCCICGRPSPKDAFDCENILDRLVVHHVIPRRKGGSDKAENLMLVCTSCHSLIHQMINNGASLLMSREAWRPFVEGVYFCTNLVKEKLSIESILKVKYK